VREVGLVGGPDSRFEPVVDFGPRELPLSADLAARHVVPLGQPQHLLRRDVQVASKRIDVKIAVRHGAIVGEAGGNCPEQLRRSKRPNARLRLSTNCPVRCLHAPSGMTFYLASLAALAGFVAVHLWGARLVRLAHAPRNVWLSLAGGVSVAYVFLHVLPELSAGQRAVARSVTLLEDFLDHHVYLLALLGLCVFYGLERLATASRQQRAKDQPSEAVFWIHVSSFAVYNVLIGYLLVHRPQPRIGDLALFFVALALHLLVIDWAMHEHHKEPYLHRGRYILAAGVVLGWLVGAITDLPTAAIAALFAFVAGGIVLNVLKEELPAERDARFWPFALGAAAYALSLLAL
jgi:hypothetical protein